MIGSLTTVAFERHGSELATIAPDSVGPVFRHFSTAGTAREGIRSFSAPPGRETDEKLRREWIDLSDQAGRGVSDSASEPLKRLGLPLEPRDSVD